MSHQGNGQPVQYEVHFVGHATEMVKHYLLETSQPDKAASFLDTLATILERLKRDPVGFGEPLYRLPNLKLIVYQGALASVIVDYGIYDERPLVFIRGIKLLS